MPETSTKPYLIRAIYEWCTDNGFTPYIAVFVDASTNVPREFVKNNEIVLNVSFDATSGLDMGNEWITFSARFGGVSRKIDVPVENVLAIYARENGQGMAFPVERSLPETQAATERENNPPPKLAPVEAETPATTSDTGPGDDDTPPPVPRIGGKKPALKVVK
ncbi:ClpXP protease specificity-enhancing factor [Cupriavidus taiwanensis]|uniref:ClpXP protease specificity-enhancing factor n=1 Tax=Cupriavidus taiwanensis TaxID=164546 RepID=A0A375I9Q7_9BURK|nr:ClpXP protease specificity-enhancing factor [Cupriavidus taiwanensis]SOY51749.1 stringent starvation protein B, ClpXP protease specificity-enhancing factor [Cupriavidus taiwanensis]SOY52028.1 stringent starvation protein B, ClpXP protease specificity-enhancing factor [Cupriavidus taiwanensis]SOY84410.1 stringent starvation protein B, ClpXP protease specificity-enhancing factor [Cupriavidus taiwanensis]SOZ59055.1 stringent starvation protein B, ClpXP protease specificity-enhancing factor [Cup